MGSPMSTAATRAPFGTRPFRTVTSKQMWNVRPTPWQSLVRQTPLTCPLMPGRHPAPHTRNEKSLILDKYFCLHFFPVYNFMKSKPLQAGKTLNFPLVITLQHSHLYDDLAVCNCLHISCSVFVFWPNLQQSAYATQFKHANYEQIWIPNL